MSKSPWSPPTITVSAPFSAPAWPPDTGASKKPNPFSKRNLLSYQNEKSGDNNPNNQQQANLNGAQNNDKYKQAVTLDDIEDNEINNGLVILIGDYENDEDVALNTSQFANLFDQSYNFYVIKSKDIISLTVSKYFNADKYDGFIIIMNKVKFTLRDIHNLLKKRLAVDNIADKPKLIISIKDEFDDNDDIDSDKDEEESNDKSALIHSSEDDEFDEDHKDDIKELFGVIETRDNEEFTKQFVSEMKDNYDDDKSLTLIVLLNDVGNSLDSGNICLNQFDPKLLLYRIIANKMP